jgi:hypothetical protein
MTVTSRKTEGDADDEEVRTETMRWNCRICGGMNIRTGGRWERLPTAPTRWRSRVVIPPEKQGLASLTPRPGSRLANPSPALEGGSTEIPAFLGGSSSGTEPAVARDHVGVSNVYSSIARQEPRKFYSPLSINQVLLDYIRVY